MKQLTINKGLGFAFFLFTLLLTSFAAKAQTEVLASLSCEPSLGELLMQPVSCDQCPDNCLAVSPVLNTPDDFVDINFLEGCGRVVIKACNAQGNCIVIYNGCVQAPHTALNQGLAGSWRIKVWISNCLTYNIQSHN